MNNTIRMCFPQVNLSNNLDFKDSKSSGLPDLELVSAQKKEFKNIKKKLGLTPFYVDILIFMQQLGKKSGWFKFSQQQIAEEISCDEKTVYRASRYFHEIGLIKKIRPKDKWATCYFILSQTALDLIGFFKGSVGNFYQIVGNIWEKVKAKARKRSSVPSFFKNVLPIYEDLSLYTNYLTINSTNDYQSTKGGSLSPSLNSKNNYLKNRESEKTVKVVKVDDPSLDVIGDFTPEQMDKLLEKQQVKPKTYQSNSGYVKKAPENHISPKQVYDKARPWREQAREILWSSGLWKDRRDITHHIPFDDLRAHDPHSPWLPENQFVVKAVDVKPAELTPEQKKEALRLKSIEETKGIRERLVAKLDNPSLEQRIRDWYIQSIEKLDRDLKELYGV